MGNSSLKLSGNDVWKRQPCDAAERNRALRETASRLRAAEPRQRGPAWRAREPCFRKILRKLPGRAGLASAGTLPAGLSLQGPLLAKLSPVRGVTGHCHACHGPETARQRVFPSHPAPPYHPLQRRVLGRFRR